MDPVSLLRNASSRWRLASAAILALVFVLLVGARAGHAAGMSGWSQVGEMINHNGGLEWGIQLVGHASVVDDAGRAYAIGGTNCYAEQDFCWGNRDIFREPEWTFVRQPINETMRGSSIHAFNYAGRLWYLAPDRDDNAFGLCVFRGSTGSWGGSRLGCVQPYRFNESVVLVNGYLYVIGGHQPNNNTSFINSVQYTKVNSSGSIGAWKTTTTLPAPSVGYATAIGNRIYAFGSYPSSTRVQSAPINADGSLGAWRDEASQPPALGEAVSIGNDIYLVGGAQTHYATVGANGVIGPWQTSAELLPLASAGSVAVKDNKLVVIGGFRPGADPTDWNANASNKVYETTTTSPPSNLELLAKYKPELRFDLLETYRADSAATMTDNCLLDAQGKIVRQNYLDDSKGKHLAAACPSDKAADLSLTYLGANQGNDTVRLDAANDYATDAQRMHGLGDYPNRTYGRVVPNIVDGGVILQYWFFYYNNPKTYYTFGAHEGDWEMIQVHLDANRQPIHATYAQHGWGEKCDWPQVERTESGRPVVYVADGSHASYFDAGFHHNQDPSSSNPLVAADDNADGGADWTVPIVEDITNPPSWMAWKGRWGGSTGTAKSPFAPPYQGLKWSDPDAWSYSVKECSIEPAQAAANGRQHRRASNPPAPPKPIVTAERRGRAVVIRYRFDRKGQNRYRTPHVLLTGVDAPRDEYPPLTYRTKVNGSAGVVRQPLGLAHGKRRVIVSAQSKAGTRSRPFAVPIRP